MNAHITGELGTNMRSGMYPRTPLSEAEIAVIHASQSDAPATRKRRNVSRFDTETELEAYKQDILSQYTYRFGPKFEFIWPVGEVSINKRAVHLTSTEADVLKTIIDSWPLPCTPVKIIANLSIPNEFEPDAIRVYIRRIRTKLHSSNIILTESRGLGYLFNATGLLKNTVAFGEDS